MVVSLAAVLELVRFVILGASLERLERDQDRSSGASGREPSVPGMAGHPVGLISFDLNLTAPNNVDVEEFSTSRGFQQA